MSVTFSGFARAESLTNALAKAYTNNPAMAAALISVKLASEDIVLRKAGQRPQVNLSGTTQYSWASVGGSTTANTNTTLNLQYNQRLFDGFKTAAQIDQARAYANATTHSLRNTEQNVLLSAATAYMDVVRDTNLASLRADNVKFLRAQVSSARNRLNIGEGTKIDVAQAEARLAQSVAAYKSAVNSLRTSQASYVRWMGSKPSGLNSNFKFGNVLPRSLDEALRSAKANHPAIQTAMAQVEAAKFGTDAAMRAFGPTLDLIGSICAIDCGGGSSQGTSGSIRLTLAIPIYQGGALGASARKANLSHINAEVDARATVNQVEEAVISAWSGLQSSIALIESANAAVRSSQIALDGVIEERNVGQRTTLDVLNARAELTSANESLYTAQRNKVVAAFSLVSAAGKLDAASLHLPVTIQSADGYRARVEDIWGELRE
ncbi:TolC family outer membrane protein [Maritalea porphyrae]|uniref:TolC family outer membrane protein n=1 Tax=Maritalea porphyrae TaxID=880732 RepID=UPI0022B06A5D|nr:TolC family outer membrane protein [Maritalea porphyrae]MCZ4273169.1 TolC family outer membrane protein [Maritalea porphyrae]